MADQDKLDQSLQNSAKLQQSLADNADSFKQLNDETKRTGKDIDNINSLSTQLNNILKDTLTLQSRIGKEYIKTADIQKQANEHTAHSVKLQAIIVTSLAKMGNEGANVKKSVEDIRNIQKEISNINDKLLQKTKEGITLTRIDYNQLTDKQIALDDILKNDTNGNIAKISYLMQQKDISDEITDILIKSIPLQEAANKKIDTQNQKLGSLGALMKGISKIPILGNLIQTEKVLERMEDTIKKGGSQWKAFGTGVGATFSEIKRLLSDPLISAGILAGLIGSLVSSVLEFDKNITDTAKNLSVSKEYSQIIYKHFEGIALNANDSFMSVSNMGKAMNELNAGFGTAVNFTDKQIESQITLTKKMGMTVEEAQSIHQLSLLNQRTADDTLKTIIKENISLISNKKIITDVSKISGQLLAQYKNSPEQLAKAVVQAEKLGVTLEQAKKASDSLLNFQSSIESELEAELLTGKGLNLEQARYLTLMGDSAGAMREMLKQVGSFSDFSRLNVIQQQSIAKSMGLSTDELTNALRQQETLNKLGVQDMDVLKKRRDELVASGDLIAQAKFDEEIRSKTNGDILLKNMEQVSLQERFQASMDKVKDAFASIASGPLIKLMTGFANILDHTTAIKGVLITAGALMAAMAISSGLVAVRSIATAAATALQTQSMIPIIGPALGLLAAGAAAAALYGIMNTPPPSAKVNDALIGPKGNIQISTPEGMIVPNKNDSIIATTNPAGLLGGSSSKGVEDKLETLIGIIQKGGHVYMDSNKVGTTQGMAWSAYA